MKKSENKIKHAYVVFTHRYFPDRKMPDGSIEVHEEIEMVDRLKTRHIKCASAIIDVLNKTVEKTRVNEATYEMLYEHFKEKHAMKHKQLMDVLGKNDGVSVVE